VLLVVGLFFSAAILFVFDLGSLPLRDWDEGIVAQVARDISQASLSSWRWLYPRLGDGLYLNKPTLVHSLIAGAYTLGGVNEWTARLPGALLTALSVPLLYGIGREVFPTRKPAIFAALVYLTWMPVVRHGRLAMLDGAVLCFFCFLIWCLLRSRRDLRWALGIGIGVGLICLSKGILGILLGAIAFLFLVWDTPRLLTSRYLWAGLLLGIAPVISWYVAQRLYHGSPSIDGNLLHHSLRRIWDAVERNSGPPWYYLLELLKYGWPWLLFLPQGLQQTWENRNMGWAKLILIWSSIYLLAISVMGTKLPWYILPLYPALALAAGFQCASAWEKLRDQPYPRTWLLGLALLAIGSWVGSIYFAGFGSNPAPDVQLTLVATGLTMTVSAVLVAKRDRQFLVILLWGTYVSLLLFVSSDHWVWELAEHYPVKPVAAMIRNGTAEGTELYTTYPDTRPSLDFYSQRQTKDVTDELLLCFWEKAPNPYLLIEQNDMEGLALEEAEILDAVEAPVGEQKWLLVGRARKVVAPADWKQACLNEQKQEIPSAPDASPIPPAKDYPTSAPLT